MKSVKQLTKEIYFLTTTVVAWVDIFTRPVYKHIIIDSIKFCQQEKGLELYAWVLMSNHLHMIAGANEGFILPDIIRDFKKYTSKSIVSTIQKEPESRRKWLLSQFEFAGRNDKKIKNFKFWKNGYNSQFIYSLDYFKQKLNYIHHNPVKAEIVIEPQEYLYSSAKNYAGEPGLLEVIIVR
jgi:putative transposase